MIDLTSKCIHQYKLNDNLATDVVLDAVGSNNGTLNNDTTDGSFTVEANPPNMNGSFRFLLGAQARVNINTPITLASGGAGGWTISFWAKGNSESGAGIGQMICGNVVLGNHYLVMIDGVKLAFYGSGIEWAWVEDTNFYNTWRHVIIQYRQVAGGSNFLTLWLDGVEQAKKTVGADSFQLNNIGAGHTTAQTAFNGWIDNFMVFEDAQSGIGTPYILSQAEIDYLYNGGNGTEDLRQIARPKIGASLAGQLPVLGRSKIR